MSCWLVFFLATWGAPTRDSMWARPRGRVQTRRCGVRSRNCQRGRGPKWLHPAGGRPGAEGETSPKGRRKGRRRYEELGRLSHRYVDDRRCGGKALPYSLRFASQPPNGGAERSYRHH
jgi:hypothetical protein